MADSQSIAKRCSRCGTLKSTGDFYARTAKCKSCVREVERARYHRNIPRRRETSLAWRQGNSAVVCEQKRQTCIVSETRGSIKLIVLKYALRERHMSLHTNNRF